MTAANVAVGDKALIIERLMEDYGDQVLRLCCVYLKDRALAEDAAQDSFVKAYKALDRAPPTAGQGEKAWLSRIAINTCKDYRRGAWFRRRAKSVPLDQVVDMTASDGYDAPLLAEVSSLPEKYRVVVLLHYYQGMSAEEIAAALSVSRSSVYSRLKAAHSMLRANLDRRYSDD
ncbi:MAG: sigma-70 family RNA polymerase sigma factor [Oscillospiraceae bacterium]|nr:sigma-70 family RNA polymerase sigma factor [Oscillospiraceae bacterium]